MGPSDAFIGDMQPWKLFHRIKVAMVVYKIVLVLLHPGAHLTMVFVWLGKQL